MRSLIWDGDVRAWPLGLPGGLAEVEQGYAGGKKAQAEAADQGQVCAGGWEVAIG